MIELANYQVTDPFFGAPYIDVDEERDEPVPHRHVHGGFEGTDTRFRFYFPPADSGYEGRMFNPLSGAHGGTEDFFGSPFGEMIGGLDDVPAPRRLHGRVEPGPHRRRHRSQAAATTPRSTATGPAPRWPASRSTSPPRSTARRRTTRTCSAAAAAGAARRCAWRTRPTCGTARCRSWAAATSPSTAARSASRARR